MAAMAALIFDCDGVLVDSEHIAISVERECLAEIGLHYETADYLNRFVGLRNADFYAELERDHQALKGSGTSRGIHGSGEIQVLGAFQNRTCSHRWGSPVSRCI